VGTLVRGLMFGGGLVGGLLAAAATAGK